MRPQDNGQPRTWWKATACPLSKECSDRSWKLVYAWSYISEGQVARYVKHHLMHSSCHGLSAEAAEEQLANLEVWSGEEHPGERQWYRDQMDKCAQPRPEDAGGAASASTVEPRQKRRRIEPAAPPAAPPAAAANAGAAAPAAALAAAAQTAVLAGSSVPAAAAANTAVATVDTAAALLGAVLQLQSLSEQGATGSAMVLRPRAHQAPDLGGADGGNTLTIQRRQATMLMDSIDRSACAAKHMAHILREAAVAIDKDREATVNDIECQ